MLHPRIAAGALVLCCALTGPFPVSAQSTPIGQDGIELRGFRFQQGDMVALVGSTFLEREGRFGYIETALTQAYPGMGL
ncbi:MAG: hypothetical protein ACKV19_22525 [Verrucomicrobiales bacterium]